MWNKLQLKSKTLVILDYPASFHEHVEEVKQSHVIHQSLNPNAEFVLSFILSVRQLEQVANRIVQRVHGDCQVWLGIPKETSSMFKCDVSKDLNVTLSILRSVGYENMNMLSIDDDWFLLQFRGSAYIQKDDRENSVLKIFRKTTGWRAKRNCDADTVEEIGRSSRRRLNF